MPSIVMERLRQGHRTMPYPDGPPPALPERWLGKPVVDAHRLAGWDAGRCPSGALTSDGLDMGRCLFCGGCAAPHGPTVFTRNFAMAALQKDDLLIAPEPGPDPGAGTKLDPGVATRLAGIRRLFSTSLKLRQVSAGGCNACEADCNVLGTLAWDMGRFGISFVASPRHADGLLITGPVTDNMLLAVEKTYRAIPDPKVVIAVGACAVSGGIHGGRGVARLGQAVPVDLFIPGCPPHPLVILEGLLRFLGRAPDPATALA